MTSRALGVLGDTIGVDPTPDLPLTAGRKLARMEGPATKKTRPFDLHQIPLLSSIVKYPEVFQTTTFRPLSL